MCHLCCFVTDNIPCTGWAQATAHLFLLAWHTHMQQIDNTKVNCAWLVNAKAAARQLIAVATIVKCRHPMYDMAC